MCAQTPVLDFQAAGIAQSAIAAAFALLGAAESNFRARPGRKDAPAKSDAR